MNRKEMYMCIFAIFCGVLCIYIFNINCLQEFLKWIINTYSAFTLSERDPNAKMILNSIINTFSNSSSDSLIRDFDLNLINTRFYKCKSEFVPMKDVNFNLAYHQTHSDSQKIGIYFNDIRFYQGKSQKYSTILCSISYYLNMPFISMEYSTYSDLMYTKPYLSVFILYLRINKLFPGKDFVLFGSGFGGHIALKFLKILEELKSTHSKYGKLFRNVPIPILVILDSAYKFPQYFDIKKKTKINDQDYHEVLDELIEYNTSYLDHEIIYSNFNSNDENSLDDNVNLDENDSDESKHSYHFKSKDDEIKIINENNNTSNTNDENEDKLEEKEKRDKIFNDMSEKEDVITKATGIYAIYDSDYLDTKILKEKLRTLKKLGYDVVYKEVKGYMENFFMWIQWYEEIPQHFNYIEYYYLYGKERPKID